MNEEQELELSLWRRDIEQRLRILEARLDQIDKHSMLQASASFRGRAELSTIRALLTELAGQSGISAERFDDVFGRYYRFALGVFFQAGADRDQGSAALLDDRDDDEIYTGEGIPMLFPEDE